MTSYERGAVVAASDPFTEMDRARPFLVVNTDAHPFHRRYEADAPTLEVGEEADTQ